MKQPTIITKVVMLVIFLAGVVYLVGAAWQIFTDPFSTIMTYEYTVDDAAEATGWLVRTEQVLSTGMTTLSISSFDKPYFFRLYIRRCFTSCGVMLSTRERMDESTRPSLTMMPFLR